MFETVKHSYNNNSGINFSYPYHFGSSIVSSINIFTMGFYITNTRMWLLKYNLLFSLIILSIKVWRRISLFALMTIFNETKYNNMPIFITVITFLFFAMRCRALQKLLKLCSSGEKCRTQCSNNRFDKIHQNHYNNSY